MAPPAGNVPPSSFIAVRWLPSLGVLLAVFGVLLVGAGMRDTPPTLIHPLGAALPGPRFHDIEVPGGAAHRAAAALFDAGQDAAWATADPRFLSTAIGPPADHRSGLATEERPLLPRVRPAGLDLRQELIATALYQRRERPVFLGSCPCPIGDSSPDPHQRALVSLPHVLLPGKHVIIQTVQRVEKGTAVAQHRGRWTSSSLCPMMELAGHGPGTDDSDDRIANPLCTSRVGSTPAWATAPARSEANWLALMSPR